jgi:hypothetical protein
MRITKMLFTLGMVLLLAGCGPEDFLNPLYTKNDLVSDPLLLGTWEQKDEDRTTVLEFQTTQDGCYTLKYSALPKDTDKPGEQEQFNYMKFDACLVQLGQTLFLDLQPTEIPVRATTETFQLSPSPHSGSDSPFTPAVFHTDDGLFVYLVPTQGDGTSETQPEFELRLSPPHWIFRIWIGQTALRLSYLEPEGDVRMLSTESLQKLVLQHADDTDFFSSGDEWQRKIGGPR